MHFIIRFQQNINALSRTALKITTICEKDIRVTVRSVRASKITEIPVTAPNTTANYLYLLWRFIFCVLKYY